MPTAPNVQALYGTHFNRIFARHTDDSLGLSSDPAAAAANIAALAALPSSATVLLRPGLWPVNSGTISARLLQEPGALLQPQSGQTLTLSGPAQSGGYQVFDTSAGGAVVLRSVREIDPRRFGAAGGDVVRDTAGIQAAIDAAAPYGTVVLPGRGIQWQVSQLTLRRGVRLVGEGVPKRGNYSEVEGSILHVPASPGDAIFVLEDPLSPGGYTEHTAVENLTLIGAATSGPCFYLDLPAQFYGKHLHIYKFSDAISLKTGIDTVFEDVRVYQPTGTGIRVRAGVVTTTTRFERVYIQGCPAEPWILEEDSCLNVQFVDCVDESCAKGGDVGKGCSATFRDHYTEDIPTGSAAAVALMTVGKTGSGSNKANVWIYGGSWQGINGVAHHAGSSCIDADYANVVMIAGMDVRRVEKIVKTTANTTAVQAMGVVPTQVGAAPWDALNAATLFTGIQAVVAGTSIGAPFRTDRSLVRLNGLSAAKAGVAPAGTAVFDITLTSASGMGAGFVRFYADVWYESSSGLRTLVKIEAAAETGAADGGAATPVLLSDDSAGNYLVQAANFAVTYPSAGTIRITYTCANPSGNNQIDAYVEGVGVVSMTAT